MSGQSVCIIGGGLAGVAATVALASRGFRVTLLESRPRLGGRASSFADATTGQLIDACQHVSMGCCTNLNHLLGTLGVHRLLASQPTLYFMTPDRRVSTWKSASLPAPFHYAGSFLGAHFLTWTEKWKVARALLALQSENADTDPPFLDWLLKHGQTPRIIERFWSVVLTSALNEVPERVGLRYARKVFVDAFMKDRRGGIVEVPTVPLGRLYGAELSTWLNQHAVRVRLNEGVRGITIEQDRTTAVVLRTGEQVQADWYVCTVPFERLARLLPESCDWARPVEHLILSPITSVHLWYDRPVLLAPRPQRSVPAELPHVVLVGCRGQWAFNRGGNPQDGHYIQIVVSASTQFRDLEHEDVEKLIAAEMAELFPICKEARLLRARVVTEKAATFSAVPGVDNHRLPQSTPVCNLFLAGDWTRTGWPATMEGAVRSGYLAAEAILHRAGIREQVLQADLDGIVRYPGQGTGFVHAHGAGADDASYLVK